jgi:hypothetical protein
MKKVIRLTESELINLVKRVISEQAAPAAAPTQKSVTTTPPQSKMAPLSDDKIILADKGELVIRPSLNKEDQGKRTTFTFSGLNVADPRTKDSTKPVVRINIKNGILPGFSIGAFYDCTEGKILSDRITFQGGEIDGPDLSWVKPGGTTINKINKKGDSVEGAIVQHFIRNLVTKPGLSTTEGPVSQIIGQFCKAPKA